MSAEQPHICPDCASTVGAVEGFPVWCARCEWRLGDAEASCGGFVRARLDRRSARMVQALYDEVAVHDEVSRRGSPGPAGTWRGWSPTSS